MEITKDNSEHNWSNSEFTLAFGTKIQVWDPKRVCTTFWFQQTQILQ